MTQSATVKRLIDDNTAEVAVNRKSACAEGCASCGGCGKNRVITASAINTIQAKPGDRVKICSKSSKILGAAALFYILPLALFLLGYLISSALRLSESISVIVSLCGLIIGLAAVPIIQKLRRGKTGITFEIIGIQR